MSKHKGVRLAKVSEMPNKIWPHVEDQHHLKRACVDRAHIKAGDLVQVPIFHRPWIDRSKYPPEKLREIRRSQTNGNSRA